LRRAEESSAGDLPLRNLSDACGLPLVQRFAVVAAGLVEEDSRFGDLFARLQGHRIPTVELLGRLLRPSSDSDPWLVCNSLIEMGLLRVTDRAAPRAEWTVRVPSLVWNLLRGTGQIPNASGLRWTPHALLDDFDALFVPESFRERLRRLPELLHSEAAAALVVRASPGSEADRIAGAVAKSLGRGTIELQGKPRPDDSRWLELGPLCAVTRATPLLRFSLSPGETLDLPAVEAHDGPVAIAIGLEGGLRGDVMDRAVTLSVPALPRDERRAAWQACLGAVETSCLDEITDRYHLASGNIRQAARVAQLRAHLAGRAHVEASHIREACGQLNRQQLDTLASPVSAHGTWESLVVSHATHAGLFELERRCRFRERLLDHLGPAFQNTANRGVRALFSGPSGTGKTLSARVLASMLGMDLYRVDLAAVVSKYIGETEKNLHEVLTRAEDLDVLLLLDEGDALLGTRTQVRTANDRYANMETDYLLQKLEGHQGIVLVTTNVGENIDSAFLRRMDAVVHFVPPGVNERREIWQMHLPETHELPDTYLDAVALRCALTGGQIRNAAEHATLLALGQRQPLQRQHLQAALRSELRKAGATWSWDDSAAEDDEGLEAFWQALAC
jgi:hypothetical protein